MATFTEYSISIDLSSGLDAALLHQEILNANPTPTAIFEAVVVGFDISFAFDADKFLIRTTNAVPGGEKTALDVVIAAHPLTTPPPPVDGGDSSSDAQQKAFPGRFFASGSTLYYDQNANTPKNEIQYSRVYLVKDQIFKDIGIFLAAGGSATRNVRMGLYDQVNALDDSSDPSDRLAQTNEVDTNVANGTFYDVPLTAEFTIPNDGYYWIALAFDAIEPKVQVTHVLSVNYPEARRETTTGTTLPATAGTLTNPTSALAFVTLVEV